MSDSPRGILVVDLGAQYAQLIARRVREAHTWCEIHPARTALDAAQNGGSQSRRGLEGTTARAAIAKLAAAEAATWVTDEAIQIYGGYGYMRHYPVEKLLRDAKGAEIYEGTNEIMRKVIAREILRDASV